MEPSDEPVLRVNSSQTALVLGGAAPSAILPYNLLHSSLDQIPLQGETAKTLSSVIAPAICSSDLSSRFRVALFLYGPSGNFSTFSIFVLKFVFLTVCLFFVFSLENMVIRLYWSSFVILVSNINIGVP